MLFEELVEQHRVHRFVANGWFTYDYWLEKGHEWLWNNRQREIIAVAAFVADLEGVAVGGERRAVR